MFICDRVKAMEMCDDVEWIVGKIFALTLSAQLGLDESTKRDVVEQQITIAFRCKCWQVFLARLDVFVLHTQLLFDGVLFFGIGVFALDFFGGLCAGRAAADVEDRQGQLQALFAK